MQGDKIVSVTLNSEVGSFVENCESYIMVSDIINILKHDVITSPCY